MAKTDMTSKAAGNFLTNKYNGRISFIDQEVKEQEALRVLLDAANKAGESDQIIAEFEKKKKALEKEIAAEEATLTSRKKTVSDGSAEVKELGALKRKLQAEVEALQSELAEGRKFLEEVAKKKAAYAAL